jgi:hypothetical protein
MYYVATINLPEIHDKPTKEEARQALGSFRSLLSEFCFVDKLDHSVALAGLLTVIVRGSISTAPMFLIRARAFLSTCVRRWRPATLRQ